MTTPQAAPRTGSELLLNGVDMMLQYAITVERPVMIVYVARGGERTTRIIEPYARQVTQAGDLIVRTMDRRSGTYRTFRLDRIEDAVILPDDEFILDPAATDRVRTDIAGVDSGGWYHDAASWSPGDPIYP